MSFPRQSLLPFFFREQGKRGSSSVLYVVFCVALSKVFALSSVADGVLSRGIGCNFLISKC